MKQSDAIQKPLIYQKSKEHLIGKKFGYYFFSDYQSERLWLPITIDKWKYFLGLGVGALVGVFLGCIPE